MKRSCFDNVNMEGLVDFCLDHNIGGLVCVKSSKQIASNHRALNATVEVEEERF